MALKVLASAAKYRGEMSGQGERVPTESPAGALFQNKDGQVYRVLDEPVVAERTEIGDVLAETLQEEQRYKEPYEIEEELHHQLHAARYAFHKVRCKVYGDAVEDGVMPVEQGREMYRRAMENYDELIKSAAGGALTEADEADMAKGFPL